MTEIDDLLVSLIKLAEQENPIETEVTLLTGGFLISGSIISIEKYMEKHPVSVDYLTDVIASGAIPANTTDRTHHMIHLRDVNYYPNSGNSILGITSFPVRLMLSAIHGFSFGKPDVE